MVSYIHTQALSISVVKLQYLVLFIRDHEYVKHGTCTGLGEFDFFSQVLKLFDKIGCFGDALNRGNVLPNDQSSYDVSECGDYQECGVEFIRLQCQLLMICVHCTCRLTSCEVCSTVHMV